MYLEERTLVKQAFACNVLLRCLIYMLCDPTAFANDSDEAITSAFISQIFHHCQNWENHRIMYIARKLALNLAYAKEIKRTYY